MSNFVDLDKLVEYREKIDKLHQLSLEGGVRERLIAYEFVGMELSKNVLITETWCNKQNNESRVHRFPLSRLDDIIEKLDEKIKYREKVIESKIITKQDK